MAEESRARLAQRYLELFQYDFSRHLVVAGVASRGLVDGEPPGAREQLVSPGDVVSSLARPAVP